MGSTFIFLCSHCIDDGDRIDRIDVRTSHWLTQLPDLVDAYLMYRAEDDGEQHPISPLPVSPNTHSFDIEVIDTFCMMTIFIGFRVLTRSTQPKNSVASLSLQLLNILM